MVARSQTWRDRLAAAEEPPPTDLGNRDRFVARHGDDVRFVPGLGWCVWDGRRWQARAEHVVRERAGQTMRSVAREAIDLAPGKEREALIKHALDSESERSLRAIVNLAESHPDIRIEPSVLDADPWLFNVENGTIDLRTGGLREHRREDLITKLAPIRFDAAARAPRWERFLEEVQPDPDVRAFLQRYAGYALSGTMGEQVFAVHHGQGENGKGVYSDTLLAVFGEYAQPTPYDTFLARRPGAATNDLAALRGARLVVASEPNEGVRLDEAAVKSITGEDPLVVRFLYREHFCYRPTCKLILTGNHRPRIRGSDHAMWRRVLLVPWPVIVGAENRDRDLRRKLKDELPGVLTWAVRGCLEWQREGLRPPAVVLAAVDEYREQEDHVGRFLADRCQLGSRHAVTSRNLRAAYASWCEAEGEDPLSSKVFGGRLTDRGIRPIRNTHGIRGRGWRGLDLGTHGTDGRLDP